MTRRPSSTKTRIKTAKDICGVLVSDGLADHLPLKQGLRHTSLWQVIL